MRSGRLREVVLSVVVTLALLATSAGARGRPAAGQSGGRRGPALVSGTVTDGHGNPLPMATVQLQSPSGGFVVQSAYTDSSGRFSLGFVQAGNYLLVIKASGYQTGSWPLQVSHFSLSGLNYALAPAASRSSSAAVPPKGSETVSVHQLLVPGKARQEYEKAVKREARGKIDEAIRRWKKSIEIYPQYAQSYMQLSRVYADRGDFASAMKAAERAVALDGKSADPYVHLGYVYLKQKEYPKAQEAFATAVGISDSDWFSQFWLGALLLREQKDAKGAYPHLLRASKLNPKSQEVCIALYDDLLALDRGQEALAELDSFLKRFPKSPLAPTVRAKRESLKKSLAAEKH